MNMGEKRILIVCAEGAAYSFKSKSRTLTAAVKEEAKKLKINYVIKSYAPNSFLWIASRGSRFIRDSVGEYSGLCIFGKSLGAWRLLDIMPYIYSNVQHNLTFSFVTVDPYNLGAKPIDHRTVLPWTFGCTKQINVYQRVGCPMGCLVGEDNREDPENNHHSIELGPVARDAYREALMSVWSL